MDQKHSYHSGKWITLIGFCTAMEIILARFLSLHTWNLKIGLSFLPVAAAALIGGPLAGGLTGALGDLIGAILFPVGLLSRLYTLLLSRWLYLWPDFSSQPKPKSHPACRLPYPNRRQPRPQHLLAERTLPHTHDEPAVSPPLPVRGRRCHKNGYPFHCPAASQEASLPALIDKRAPEEVFLLVPAFS